MEKKARPKFSLRRLVSGLFPGGFPSTQKGLRGYEIEELRQFRLGDDPRALHRKASVKRGELVVSLKEVQKAARFLFLVDRSRSVEFGTSKLTKEELQAFLLELLAPLAAEGGNQVGFITFTDRVEECWPPRFGIRGALEKIKQVSSHGTTSSLTDLNPVFEHLNRLSVSTSVIIVLSDFIAAQNFERSLEIASGKHDVIPIVLEDEREWELPKMRGFVTLRDMESGRLKYVDLNQAFVRDNSVFEVFKKLDLDWLVISTNETEGERIRKLADFFRRRRTKRKRRR